MRVVSPDMAVTSNDAGPGESGTAVRSVLDAYLNALRNAEYSTETITNREYLLHSLDHWMRQRTGRDLLTATTGDYQEWLTWLRTTTSPRTHKPRSPGTRRQYLMHVRAFCAWATDYGYLDTDPVARVPLPNTNRPPVRVFPEDAIPVAIRCAPEPVKTWLVLGLYLGLRLSECRRMERGDVREQEDPPLLHVRGKGGRDRLLPLSAEVLVALHPWLRGTHRGLLFPDPRTHAAYERRRASHMVADYLRGLGIEATMHWARHRAATKAIRDGHRVTAVQAFLGHASLSSTMIYVHEAEEAVRAIVDELGMDMARVTGRPDLRLILSEPRQESR